jgi:phage FluMu protein Com
LRSAAQRALMAAMAPKHHPTPLSGGDRKALRKELGKSRAMTGILARQSDEARAEGEALIRKADNLACQSWNERMWSDGGPAQPSPTIGRAINGGFPWLEVRCSRCKTLSSVDLCEIERPPDTCVHQLDEALRCRKCSRSGWRPRGVLHQLAPSRLHTPPEI